MSNSRLDLRIEIPDDNFLEPESIKEEGNYSFKFDETFTGRKRKAENFGTDLPQQPQKKFANK